MVPTLSQLEAEIRDSDAVRLNIVRDIGSFTIALFAMSDSPERLELAGTGTLYRFQGSHFILTAAHVWYEVLRTAQRVGITLDENIDHSFFIDVAAIVPSGPPRPQEWNEWGPDVIFLRVPDQHLGTINAYRLFYDPTIDGARPNNADGVEALVLMGTPAALGEFRRVHANITINGAFVGLDPPNHVREGFDYLDLDMDIAELGAVRNFGGVSGGGLWSVLARWSPSGAMEWARTLVGVAFYQLRIENGHRTVRCHGIQSIEAAKAYIQQPI